MPSSPRHAAALAAFEHAVRLRRARRHAAEQRNEARARQRSLLQDAADAGDAAAAAQLAEVEDDEPVPLLPAKLLNNTAVLKYRCVRVCLCACCGACAAASCVSCLGCCTRTHTHTHTHTPHLSSCVPCASCAQVWGLWRRAVAAAGGHALHDAGRRRAAHVQGHHRLQHSAPAGGHGCAAGVCMCMWCCACRGTHTG
jgi:hypothetical protein